MDYDSQVVLERFELLWPKGTATKRTEDLNRLPLNLWPQRLHLARLALKLALGAG